MSTVAALPPIIHGKLARLARRIYRLRTVRGLSRLLLVMAVTAAGALLADAFFELSGPLRELLLAAWMALGVFIAATDLILPLRRSLDLRTLAALVERKYPELSEELTSAVELAQDSQAYHGSPALIALLQHDVAERVQNLDLASAVSGRRSGHLALAAAACSLLALSPLLLWPDRYFELGQRFLFPWQTAGSETASMAVLPVNEPEPEAEPEFLPADSPTITVVPPEYARKTIATQTLHGCEDIWALQHSRIAFAFHFSRPVGAGFLEWSPASEKTGQPVNRLPLELAGDHTSGRVELSAQSNGTYRVVIEGERGRQVRQGPRVVTLDVDQPPTFTRVSGTDAFKVVRRDEVIPLDINLADDLGVEEARIEYRVNDGPSTTLPLRLEGQGSRATRTRGRFELAGKVKEGDTVAYRLVATDNRRVPEISLGPNVSFYPPDRWRKVQIARSGESLDRQEIVARRQEVNRQLDAIVRDLKTEKNGLAKLRRDGKERPAGGADQDPELHQARRENKDIVRALQELAADAAESPQSKPLADPAANLAKQEMNRSDQALAEAEDYTQAAPRDRPLQKAEREVSRALQVVEELRTMNEHLAQDRLDELHLKELAQQQQHLAEKAQLAAKVASPAEQKALAEQMRQEQQHLSGDLQGLADKNEALREALEAAREARAQELAEQARELAQKERDLAKEAMAANPKDRKDQQTEQARKQKELVGDAGKLEKELAKAAAAKSGTGFKSDAARKAAEALKRGDVAKARRQQEKATQDLLEQAQQLSDRESNIARAERLARQQAEAAAETDRVLASHQRQPSEGAASAQQRQLAEEAEAIFGGDRARVERDRAMRALDLAQRWLPLPQLARAQWDAADALRNLADVLAGRTDEASQIAELARAQRQLADEAVGKAKSPDGGERTGPQTADQEADLVHRLNRLRPKGLEDLRLKAMKEMTAALTRLKSVQQPAEAKESLNEAADAVEALAQQLASSAPKDPASQQLDKGKRSRPTASSPRSQAEQLARRQQQLADVTRRLQEQAAQNPNDEDSTDPQTLEQLAQQQEELNDQVDKTLNNLPVVALAGAREAVGQAAEAMALAAELRMRGQSYPAQVSQNRAARALERAAEQTEAAAPRKGGLAPDGDLEETPKGTPGKEGGPNLAQAQAHMHDAQDELDKGQMQKAQESMQQAAAALNQATAQLAAQQKSGGGGLAQSRGGGSGGNGSGDLAVPNEALPRDVAQRWGDLPGELRTKVLQDWEAKYGDDYARIIKLYFEQVASRERK
jgi:hypothetical protein